MALFGAKSSIAFRTGGAAKLYMLVAGDNTSTIAGECVMTVCTLKAACSFHVAIRNVHILATHPRHLVNVVPSPVVVTLAIAPVSQAIHSKVRDADVLRRVANSGGQLRSFATGYGYTKRTPPFTHACAIVNALPHASR
jgi:hypothetical protein